MDEKEKAQQLKYIEADIRKLKLIQKMYGNVNVCENCLRPFPEMKGKGEEGYTECCNELQYPLEKLLVELELRKQQWLE